MTLLHQFQAIIDPSNSQLVDLTSLKQLAAKGIPNHPPHIRSYTYSLLLGILPTSKSQWEHAICEQKKRYNSLLDIFLGQLESLPKPSCPLTSHDQLLVTITRDVTYRHKRHPFLRVEFDNIESAPLSSRALSDRVRLINTPLDPDHATPPPPARSSPRISLTTDKPAGPRPPRLQTPQLSLSLPTGPTSPITLLSPKPIPVSTTPQSHGDILIRLLYTTCRAHSEWPYHAGLVDILVPLYTVFTDAYDDPEERTFTAFESLLAKMSSAVFSSTHTGVGQLISSFNPAFIEWLCDHHLDPDSPLYTYRWTTSLFTADTPPHCLLSVWDLLLAGPPDILINLCAAALLTVRPLLLHPVNQRGMWHAGDDDLIRNLGILRSIPLHRPGMLQTFRETALHLAQKRKASPVLDTYTPSVASWPSGSLTRQVSLVNVTSWWNSKSTESHTTPSDDAASSSRLQQRLAGLASTPASSHIKYPSLSNALPKPLLLSKSARRVSSTSNSQPDRRRDSTPVSPPSALTSATLSPPSSTGLYRIGSRQGMTRSSHSSIADSQGPLQQLQY